MEKVMESHGILASQTCTNPGLVLCYSSLSDWSEKLALRCLPIRSTVKPRPIATDTRLHFPTLCADKMYLFSGLSVQMVGQSNCELWLLD